jgi:hypothetical protein
MNTDQDFEERLRKAMQRVDAPATMVKFLQAAAEVQAERLLPQKERKHKWAFFLPQAFHAPQAQFAGWMTGALAAVLALGVFFGGEAYKQHERRVIATQEFETATHITDQALAHARQQLERAGVPLD